MKLWIKILITVAAILFIATAVPAAIYLQFSYVTTWKYCAEFDEFSEEFQKVAGYVLSKSAGKTGYYDVSLKENGDKTLYDPETKHYLDLPAEVSVALDRLDSKDAFPHKDSGLDLIYYSGQRVDFQKEGGSYKLVYAPKEKPTFWRSPTDGESILVKSIGNGWYHIVVR